MQIVINQLMKNKLSRGFTLLEVLIALLVLSVGLLGLAGLQTRGLAAVHNAYLRSQAVLLARDMGERIRANNNYLISTASDLKNEYTIDYERSHSSSDCVSNPCSPENMARFDVDQWLLSLANTLPSGDGEIDKTGTVYSITVRWNANRSSNEDDFKTYIFNVS